MKKILILALAAVLANGCSFRGFKPAPDASAGWRLHKSANPYNTMTDEGFFNYVVKMHADFRACNLDPVGGGPHSGGNPDVHSEAGGYICLEEKGWYNRKGPTCLSNWLYFDEPECVAWREKRGLSNAPCPKKYGKLPQTRRLPHLDCST